MATLQGFVTETVEFDENKANLTLENNDWSMKEKDEIGLEEEE